MEDVSCNDTFLAKRKKRYNAFAYEINVCFFYKMRSMTVIENELY